MSKKFAGVCKKDLVLLLCSYYPLKLKAGSKVLKQLPCTNHDLKALAIHRQVIQNLMLDCIQFKADSQLPLTEKQLPTNPTSKELATAALYHIALALLNRHDLKLGVEYLDKAKGCLIQAEKAYVRETLIDDDNPMEGIVKLGVIADALTPMARAQIESNHSLAKTVGVVKAATAARNKRLKCSIMTEVKLSKGIYWKSDTALAKHLWNLITAAKETNHSWHDLAPEDLCNKLGYQTVFQQVQNSKVLEMFHKKG